MQTDIEQIRNTSADPINKKSHDESLENFKHYSAPDFFEKIAYIAIQQGFNELRVFQFPSKPEICVEYERLTLREKSRLTAEYFIKNYEINDYAVQCSKIKFKNLSTYDWLCELKSHIPADDFPRQEQLDNRINQFKIWFSNNNISFKKTETEQQEENQIDLEAVQKLEDMFSAEQI